MVQVWFGIYGNSFLLQKPLKNFERVELGNQQSLDYSQYDLDENQNLIFYGQNGQVGQNGQIGQNGQNVGKFVHCGIRSCRMKVVTVLLPRQVG